jgi:TfoX/Sxy family transcriptional regulator of competence genes
MAYNEKLADRIRESLEHVGGVKEKFMFGGVCFMVNDKMCMGVVKDEIMCRVDPVVYDEVVDKKECRPMDFTGKPMKGYVFISDEAIKTKKEMDYWVGLCLEFNKKAKSSKTKSKKK